MAIVLPDAILGAPGLVFVRHWIIQNCRIIASIDLHPDTFQPRNGTQTSVLVLQRKADSEIRAERKGGIRDYEIFMAELQAIGHDKRGNTVYRRNAEGEIILFPEDDERPPMLERVADGTGTVRPLRQIKIPDDDTGAVTKEFLEWKGGAVLGW